MERGRTLGDICQPDELPSRTTVNRWRDDDVDGFSVKFQHARRKQAEAWVENALDIADDNSNDVIQRSVVDGTNTKVEQLSHPAAVQRSKLRVEARLRVAAMMHPEIYGARAQVNLNVTNPINTLLARAAQRALPYAAADIELDKITHQAVGEADIMANDEEDEDV